MNLPEAIMKVEAGLHVATSYKSKGVRCIVEIFSGEQNGEARYCLRHVGNDDIAVRSTYKTLAILVADQPELLGHRLRDKEWLILAVDANGVLSLT